MEALREACRALTGAAPVEVTPLHGGDLSEVKRLGFAEGPDLVAKLGPLVDREARMLAALAEAGVHAPRVVGHSGEVLLLEALDEVRPGPKHWARFGEDLARLHQTTGPGYGWTEDYAFGPVTIYNAPMDDWPRFWAERRLLPFVSALDPGLAQRVERLADRLGALLPAAPAPGLLHGDLWTGNLIAEPRASVSFEGRSTPVHANLLTDDQKACGNKIMPCVSRFEGRSLVIDR